MIVNRAVIVRGAACLGGGLKFNSTPGNTSSSGEQMMNMTIDFVYHPSFSAPLLFI